MNTQVWRQLHIQILRKVRGGKFQTSESDLFRNIPHSYYQKSYDFGLSSDCEGTADCYPSGFRLCKTSEALDARPLLCLVRHLNSVSVSVSSVKYHNKAVVQRTKLYTKKANWKEAKAIYS